MSTQNDDPNRREELSRTQATTPANPSDVPGKAKQPDPDRTESGTLPTSAEEAGESMGESLFTSEHDISRDHAEPTDVTGTTNDKAIDGEYIDVGGGD